jgi:hypothetical protein
MKPVHQESWKSSYTPIEHQYVITNAANSRIAVIKAEPGTADDRDAAFLIAAAPDLARALTFLLAADAINGDLARQEARAALAKANGL